MLYSCRPTGKICKQWPLSVNTTSVVGATGANARALRYAPRPEETAHHAAVAATFCPPALAGAAAQRRARTTKAAVPRVLVLGPWSAPDRSGGMPEGPQFDPVVSAARVPCAVAIQGCCRPVQAER